jgi:hypothetical protein
MGHHGPGTLRNTRASVCRMTENPTGSGSRYARLFMTRHLGCFNSGEDPLRPLLARVHKPATVAAVNGECSRGPEPQAHCHFQALPAPPQQKRKRKPDCTPMHFGQSHARRSDRAAYVSVVSAAGSGWGVAGFSITRVAGARTADTSEGYVSRTFSSLRNTRCPAARSAS